jgi:flagellar hook assembly protein FlgD
LQLSIGLFDLSGRRVVELGSGTFSEGPHSLVWEGRDATGRAVSAGTYLLQLSAPGICEHQKLVLLK